ncbi:hypothetical protein [Paraburkholderia sp. ZP32-5]|uniref:hypothetical protein n=1 Tax=Paraburkholderia sp. ZP32-5 TaxID=2883245 RepID=UPI001F2B8420|nr:hypothetical protein [Paraburkholderia sp. ZP32-5]
MSKASEKTKSEAKSAVKDESKGKTEQRTGDLAHPHQAVHNDNAHSKMPERHDEGRKQSPADHPGKQPGEGEPSVS